MAKKKELEQSIKKHQKLYYEGNPEISDEEFDKLWDELKLLDPDNLLFSTINSESTDGFPKEYHIIPMGSQEKAANPEAFLAWVQKLSFNEFIVQYKLDGASLELQYENGNFVRAVTRGDGRIGDDITNNAKKMKGLVFNIDSNHSDNILFSGAVRGEVIMTHSVHAQKYADKANCRNAANGLMKRKDGIGSEDLCIICYDAVSGTIGNPFTGYAPFLTELEKLDWLKKVGFDLVPFKKCTGAQAVIDFRSHIMDIRASLPYDIDGLVIKGNEIDHEDLKRSRPEKQIAFKFSLEEAVSTLKAIEWSESGVTYTPIALIEPVQLAGTIVQRANLSNPNMIESLNLKIGSRVIVTKRGEIIPKIEALVENPPEAYPIELPVCCTSCNTLLINEGTRLRCPNSSCPKIIHHRIEKWIQILDIRDFGENLIKRLFESKRLQSISDLYTLTIEELSSLERMGKLSAEKVLKSLHARTSISLSSFIAGFDIEGIGETMVDKLIEAGYDRLDKMLIASEEDFASVFQFGPILAKNLVQGLEILGPEMNKLVQNGIITIIYKEKNLPFSGYSFCFTGELTTIKRKEAEFLVLKLGGSIKSSVVKDLSFLVTNTPDSGSSKNVKAREFSIPIINEAVFFQMIDQKNPLAHKTEMFFEQEKKLPNDAQQMDLFV